MVRQFREKIEIKKCQQRKEVKSQNRFELEK